MSSAPDNFYVPAPVAVRDPNFDNDPSMFPPGWQPGGANLNTNYAIAYNTTSPYVGAASLILNSTSGNAGISQNLGPVVPGEVYQITAALKNDTTHGVAAAQLVFLDVNGNQVLGPVNGILWGPAVASNEDTDGTNWHLRSNQGTVPLGAVSMQVQVYTGVACVAEFSAVAVTRLSSALSYYLSRIPHQYQTAVNFKQLLLMLMSPLVDLGVCASAMNAAFSIDAAVGVQLDVLGALLGAPRQLPFAPVGVNAQLTVGVASPGVHAVTTTNTQYMDVNTPMIVGSGGGGELITPTLVSPGVGFTANFGFTHSNGDPVTSAAPSQTLGDDDYRTLLKAKILQNQWDGQADSLWEPWQQLFPGGQIYITDNQNMTATIFLVGLFGTVAQQMITNGLIVPRPESVQYTYDFATLPIFGFDNINPTLVAGFDIGNWS